MDRELRIALSEINQILKLSEGKVRNKIPYKFRKYIIENMDKDYIPKVNANLPLEEQEISDKAKEMLSEIYQKYLKSEKDF